MVLGFGAMAQSSNPVVPQSDIQFWAGTGSNRAVIAVTWEDDDENYIGIAWGVQWNGTASLAALMDTIEAYDDNLTIAHGTTTYTLVNNMTYTNTELGLNLVGTVGWWWYNWIASDGTDKTMTSMGAADDIIVTGDFVDWMQYGVADTMIMAPNPTSDPVDATIAFEDILYWVGEGSNEAAFIISFAEPDTALAWGFRYNQATIQDMMDALSAADPRLTIIDNPSNGGDLYFVNAPGDTLRLSPVDPTIGYNFWWTNLNGLSVASYGTVLQDGDYFKFGDYNSAIGWDFQYGYYMQEAWTTEVHPVSVPSTDPMPEEATISAEQISYWVGEGNNKVVLAVNWADTALAWGYKFSTDSVTVQQVMDAITAADHRFSYTMNGSYLDDILFVLNGTDTLRKQMYSYWESKNNGVGGDQGLYQNLGNGDFEKWAEPAAGVVIDSFSYEYNGVTYWSYIYVYTMEIHPVSDPAGIAEVEAVEVTVYPNPVATMLSVRCERLNRNTEVAVYDMTGRKVYGRAVAAGNSEVQVPVSQLPNGAYMLRVGEGMAKVVVRH